MVVAISHMKYIVAAADHRSFRRAAAALHISQPTLSKRIRELEANLGVSLFERSTGGSQLTPVGKEFAVSARRILGELATMENRARAGVSGNTGRLVIGFYTSLSTGDLRNTILTFSAQYPGVDVNVITGGRAFLISQLDRGAVDIVVVLGEPNHVEFDQMGLWSERIMVALPEGHRLVDRNVVYWTDIKTELFLISRRDPGPEMQDILIHNLAAPGERPTIKCINANTEDILSLVGGNHGICLICESSMGNKPGGVVYRQMRDSKSLTRVGYVAYWRSSNSNPALMQMLKQLSATLATPKTSLP